MASCHFLSWYLGLCDFPTDSIIVHRLSKLTAMLEGGRRAQDGKGVGAVVTFFSWLSHVWRRLRSCGVPVIYALPSCTLFSRENLNISGQACLLRSPRHQPPLPG